MRGFLYLKDSEPLIRKIITVIQEQLQSFFELNKFNNSEVEKKISDKIEKLIYKETLKEPVVMFKIIDVDNPPNS